MGRVLASHVVFSTYGFRLPNDPRGSGSTEVRAPNIAAFGAATKTHERRSVASRPHDRALRLRAKLALVLPEVALDGAQALSVGSGFAAICRTSGYQVYACSILPQHVHMVIGRHRYPVEQVVKLLRQAATLRLLEDGRHPFAHLRAPNGRPPSVWSQDFRKVFLFTPEEVVDRIRYVEDNPLKEGKPRQTWSFVVPFLS